jgi:hypothetical protein
MKTHLHEDEEHQAKDNEWVEVYYKRILKLANCLQIKATNTCMTIVFIACFHPFI